MPDLPPAREVFLSYASSNRDMATRIAGTLRRHGVPVWYSVSDIRGAQQWHDEIGEALKRCDWFVLVLSPNAVKSEWVRRELLYALNDSRYKDHIAPVQYRDCDSQRLSWTISAFQHIDFTKGFAGGCRELLRTWGKGFRGT